MRWRKYIEKNDKEGKTSKNSINSISFIDDIPENYRNFEKIYHKRIDAKNEIEIKNKWRDLSNLAILHFWLNVLKV